MKQYKFGVYRLSQMKGDYEYEDIEKRINDRAKEGWILSKITELTRTIASGSDKILLIVLEKDV